VTPFPRTGVAGKTTDGGPKVLVTSLCVIISRLTPHIEHDLSGFQKCRSAQGSVGLNRGKSGNYCRLFTILIRFS
jgi:hypothetical protein